MSESGGSPQPEVSPEETERRLRAIDDYAGEFSDCFYPGYLEDLRSDWPE